MRFFDIFKSRYSIGRAEGSPKEIPRKKIKPSNLDKLEKIKKDSKGNISKKDLQDIFSK